MDTIELRQKRGQAIAAAEYLLKTADAEKRSLTPEEEVQYDRMWAEQSDLQRQIERAEALERVKAEAAPIIDVVHRAAPVAKRFGADSQEYRDAFMGYVRTGNPLQVGANDEGGYTVPTTMLNRLIELGREANALRRVCQVIQTTNTTTIPTVSANTVGYWKAEEAAYVGGENTFGQASLGAYKATGLAKVSEELLQDSGVDIEGFLVRNFAETMGALEEQAFLVGDGNIASVAPINGLLAGSVQAGDSGVTYASETAITAAEIMDTYYALAPRFRANATWILNDSTVKLVRKLTDGGTPGQFIWQPGLQANQPDVLMGRPVLTSPFMPLPTKALKAVLFGDFSYAIIGDRSPYQVQRLNELYAGNGQIGFKCWHRTDIAVTQSTAIQWADMKN